MKVGISVRIDVTKIDKSKLYQGAKGNYLDMTTFVDLDNKDEYENNGFISHSQTKEERASGSDKGRILGNVKVFWTDGQQQGVPQQSLASNDDFDDDIPF